LSITRPRKYPLTDTFRIIMDQSGEDKSRNFYYDLCFFYPRPVTGEGKICQNCWRQSLWIQKAISDFKYNWIWQWRIGRCRFQCLVPVFLDASFLLWKSVYSRCQNRRRRVQYPVQVVYAIKWYNPFSKLLYTFTHSTPPRQSLETRSQTHSPKERRRFPYTFRVRGSKTAQSDENPTLAVPSVNGSDDTTLVTNAMDISQNTPPK